MEDTVAQEINESIVRNKKAETALRLRRNIFTAKSTIGDLFIGEVFECYILEDTVRETKIPKITAIPAGTYEIQITFSNRFQVLMPLLLDVPRFTGIRIHPGNYPKNTDGCLLPGTTKAKDFVGLSRQAYGDLYPKLEAMLKNGKVFIEITNERRP